MGLKDYPLLDVVSSVDINRYLGKWYEITSIPVSQQKGCFCTTAEYSLMEDGVIKVVNTCRKNSVDGEITKAEGKAFIVPESNNAKLKVQFFWPFKGDYWIIDLDENYQYAVVGVPSRKYCWILSRTPELDENIINRLKKKLSENGFETEKMQQTIHGCTE